jgi:cystathionine gamma-synthase
MAVATNEQSVALGAAIPPFTAHAISVSLPTWRDNVGYEEGEKRVVDTMVIGYPRFFLHPSIRKVSNVLFVLTLLTA